MLCPINETANRFQSPCYEAHVTLQPGDKAEQSLFTGTPADLSMEPSIKYLIKYLIKAY